MKVVIEKTLDTEIWHYMSVNWITGDAHDLTQFDIIFLLEKSHFATVNFAHKWNRTKVTGGNISYTNVQTKKMAKIFICKHFFFFFAILQPWQS